jgi:hypothetical protein
MRSLHGVHDMNAYSADHALGLAIRLSVHMAHFDNGCSDLDEA